MMSFIIGTGVQAFSLHPGGVSTDLGRYIGGKFVDTIFTKILYLAGGVHRVLKMHLLINVF